MRYYCLKLTLLLLLFVAGATQQAWACGNGSASCEKSVAEKSCCAKSSSGKQAGNCDHVGNACSEKKGCSGQKCPCGTVSCGFSGGLLAEPTMAFPKFNNLSERNLRQVFYFNQHIPEAVYLSIWQPPQLGA
jgi:hypothetical protein